MRKSFYFSRTFFDTFLRLAGNLSKITWIDLFFFPSQNISHVMTSFFTRIDIRFQWHFLFQFSRSRITTMFSIGIDEIFLWIVIEVMIKCSQSLWQFASESSRNIFFLFVILEKHKNIKTDLLMVWKRFSHINMIPVRVKILASM